jgi:hypothetical protein
MPRLVAAIALLGALVACAEPAPPQRATLLDACVRDGGSQTACTCMADAAIEKLEAPLLNAMALGAEGRDDEADAAMQALTMDQQLAIAAFASEALQTCGLE